MRAGLFLGACLATAAQASPATRTISPATSRIEYTVFALGFVPMTAHFDDFIGTLITDPASAKICQVQVSVRVASLHMIDPVRARLALGLSMLDAAHYPTMSFTGACAGETLNGALTLHGRTHPLAFALTRQGEDVTASGVIQRRDYAILGMAGLVGPRIRIHLQTHLAAAVTPQP